MGRNIITSINGVRLDSPAKMLDVRRSLTVGPTVRLQALRAGAVHAGWRDGMATPVDISSSPAYRAAFSCTPLSLHFLVRASSHKTFSPSPKGPALEQKMLAQWGTSRWALGIGRWPRLAKPSRSCLVARTAGEPRAQRPWG